MKHYILLLYIVAALRDSEALRKGSTDYEDMSFWLKSGQETLHRILAEQKNENRAKNVIIFIGDGMGLSTITSGRIYVGQLNGQSGEEYQLSFEKFFNTALAKTYNVDKQVPDSAGTATAIFSGVKTKYRLIGLDARAQYGQCDKKINALSKVTTVADWAQQSGMDTGFVTTTRITHATPAGLYAHVNHRWWECDTAIPKDQRSCIKDIARQLVEDKPGSQFKVILGGGAQQMGLNLNTTDDSCERSDGRNLVKEWQANHPKGKAVTNMQDLMSIDISNTSHIFGVFSPGHMPFHAVKTAEIPSLANMTMQAIRLLKKNKNGFLLMVESGKIDTAHHGNWAKLALRELYELDEAVKVALRLLNMEETLIIVTADHSHSFTLNGYPERGNDILGFANKTTSQPPYETLSYANGLGFFYHRRNDSNNVNETWRRIEDDPTRDEPFYRHFAGKYLGRSETHGGEDVGVYAAGPYSHLFRGTFEQNYIAHAVAYAACLKDWPSHCDRAYHRYFYDVNMAPPNSKKNSAGQNTSSTNNRDY